MGLLDGKLASGESPNRQPTQEEPAIRAGVQVTGSSPLKAHDSPQGENRICYLNLIDLYTITIRTKDYKFAVLWWKDNLLSMFQ